MSNLIIANLSKQHHHFLYRVPESEGVRMLDILVGAQVRVPGDLSESAVKGIIDHHRQYGMKSAAEAAKMPSFTGLVYSLDGPIPLNDNGFVADVFKANNEALSEKNEERRASTAEAITAQLATIGANEAQPLRRVEVEQVEETPGNTPGGLASGVEAVVEGVQPRQQGKQRGK